MPLKPDDSNGTTVDSAGPLNALEADRYCEELSSFEFKDLGGHRWMQQNEFLNKLNLQAHVNASQQRDEFVLEAIVLHEKMPLIIRELIASELWKENAYPLIKDWLSEHNSVKGYLLLFQEGVLANLLEAMLYHKSACEAAGDLIVELVDYCHRKLMFLLNTPPPYRPADPEELKKVLMKEAQEEHSKEQEYSINMSCAIACVSIMRFLTDHLEQLPLAVTARLLDTYDILMLLCPMLEQKPWESKGEDGEMRRFYQNHWQRVAECDERKMHKCEAQCWLAVYNLVQSPEVRRRYQFNTFRKNALLRVRKFLHEGTVDQIPILTDLQRSLDEMALSEPPSAAEAKPAYVLEQLPELREQLTKGVNWRQVVEEQKATALNDTEEEKRAQAMQLSGVFDLEGMEDILAAEAAARGDLGRPEERQYHYYLQVKVMDEATGKEVLSITAESQEAELKVQGAYIIPNEAKQQLLPAKYNESAKVVASLDVGDGKSTSVSGSLTLLKDKKKQWLQLGFDQYGLRVQLHLLAEASGSGFHIIHARVTPPPPCVLTLKFVARKGGAVHTVRAKGRGVASQTSFTVDQFDSHIRVPKASSASATLAVNAGEGEETCECEPIDLSLSGATQMVWKQIGKESTELRVQIKLAPATEGGFVPTAIRVTPPARFRIPPPAPPPADSGPAADRAPDAAAAAPAAPPPAAAAQAPPAAPPPSPPKPPPAPAAPPKPPKPEPVQWTAEDDSASRFEEIDEAEATPTPPPPVAPTPPPPVASSSGDESPAQPPFVAASAFGGARAGYVFKKGPKGLGYYWDTQQHRQQASVSGGGAPVGSKTAQKKVGFAAGDQPTGTEEEAADPEEVARAAEGAAKKQAADALFSGGEPQAAASAYTALLEAMPPSTAVGHAALCNRSACYLALKQWDACAADCEEALGATRETTAPRAKVKLHLRRAEARLALGLRELAIADTREAERIAPHGDTASEAQVEAMRAKIEQAKLPGSKVAGLKSPYAPKVSAEPTKAPLHETQAAAQAAAVEVAAETAGVKPAVQWTVAGEAPGRNLTVEIVLPGVAKISQVNLEMTDQMIHIHGAGFALDQELPFAVDSAAAAAKFSSKAATLRVKAAEVTA